VIDDCTSTVAAALGTGSFATINRFTDNGDGTITDHVMKLMWEKR